MTLLLVTPWGCGSSGNSDDDADAGTGGTAAAAGRGGGGGTAARGEGGESGTSESGGSAGTGGSGARGGTGGTGGSGTTPPPEPVSECGFEGADLGNCAFDGWLIDNTLGAQKGSEALHPPPFDAGDSATTSFDCNGEVHSQLRFFLHPMDGNLFSVAQASLDLYVDGELYKTFAGDGGGWREIVINLSNGTHTYEFTAQADVDTQKIFALDTFVCTDFPPEADENSRVGFDDGFIPVELTQQDWFVDNLLGVQAGEAALHPPPLDAGDSATTSFDCAGIEHSQLRFFLHPMDGNLFSVAQASLDLHVDGELYKTFAGDGGGWREFVINLPNGTHTYEFTAQADVDTQKIFALDTFVCTNTPPEADENSRVGFDDGFIPVELNQQDWFVDNLLGVQAGEAALHPPPLDAGDSATTSFDCAGIEHSQLRFFLHPMDGNLFSVAQASLDLYVDGELYKTFAGDGGGWREFVINLPNDTHTYEFTAHAEVDTQKIFALDTFVCTNFPPEAGENSRVGFDDGFIPVELDQQDWFVDNLLGVQAGNAALHPRPLETGDNASTSFDCNDEAHSRLTFFFHPMDANLYSEAQARLELHVDGDLYRTFSGDGGGWRQVVIDLPEDTHTYEFKAFAEVDSQKLFALDTFSWE